MWRAPLLLLLLVVLLAGHDSSAAGAKRSKEGKEARRKSVVQTITLPGRPGVFMNICDSFHIRTLNVYCHCSTLVLANATEASCWVFGKSENETAPIWDSFTSQPNLETLKINVREESIHKFIPTRALSFLRKLKYFEITYATIAELLPYAFANLTTLQELQLQRNQIVVLKPRSFAWLPNLTAVNLGENNIAEIQREVFLGLPLLRRLFLNHNNITTLHDGAFTHLSGLDELELHDNQLSVLTRETFSGLKMLRRLLLNNNKLRMLGDCTFCEMPHLTELYLNENGLQYLSSRAFEGLSRLTRLMLSDNLLQVLAPGSFNGMARMRYLDLRNNHLHNLLFETVKPLIEGFKNTTSYFYIDGNRLICDCRLDWIYTLRNDTPNEQIRAALDETDCILEGAEPAPGAHKAGLLKAGRYFPGSTDVPSYIRDEPALSRFGSSQPVPRHDPLEEETSGNLDEDYADQDDEEHRPRPMPPGAARRIMELDPEQLPCPQPAKAPAATIPSIDANGNEFDETNGVQTLTGPASSAAASLASAAVATALACAAVLAA